MTRASGAQPPAVVVGALGRRVRVDAGGHPAAAQVEALWSRCRVSGGDHGDHGHPGDLQITLPRTDRPLSAETTMRLAVQIRDAAREAAGDRLLLLRAAAVSTPSGAVVALLSGSPELRAAAATELSRRGFGYVASEVLAMDESFEVTAFPEPIAFQQPGEPLPVLAGPDALGLRPSPEQLHLTAVVVLDHDPARTVSELTRMPRPDDVRRVAPAVLTAPAEWAETAVADLVDEADGVWQLSYRELDDAAPLLADLLDRRLRPIVGPLQLYVAVGVGDEESRDTGPRRSPVSGHDLALDGLRRTVWLAAAGGASLDSLHVAANRDLGGEHHVSVQLVAAAVRDLMALGLLVPEEGSVRAFADAGR